MARKINVVDVENDMLDIRDVSIINSLPFDPTSVIEIGCGTAKIGKFLHENGVDVLSTDIYVHEDVDSPFRIMSVFDPVDDKWDSVLCAQVLEHLDSWEVAFRTLIHLAIRRVIVTVPVEKSFMSPDHVNFWSEEPEVNQYKDENWMHVDRFKDLALPYSTSISRIRTKPRDVQMGQSTYLIVVDKLQKWSEYE